jgi:hypothetical protein
VLGASIDHGTWVPVALMARTTAAMSNSPAPSARALCWDMRASIAQLSRRVMGTQGRLEGKVAVITGGASGIGEGSVRRFIEEGARVIIADLQDAPGQALAKELGPNTRFIHTDVAVEDDVAAAIQLAVSDFVKLLVPSVLFPSRTECVVPPPVPRSSRETLLMPFVVLSPDFVLNPIRHCFAR